MNVKNTKYLHLGIDKQHFFLYFCHRIAYILTVKTVTVMKTKKSLLPEVYQDLRREEELEETEVHIIDTDVWYN